MERRRQRGRALELGCRELAGQLEEGQRVAARLRDEPLGDLVCRVSAQPGCQEGAGFLGVEAGEDQLGQAGRLEGRRRAVTRREHHCHPVRSEPSGAEQQRSRAGGVQPVCVVDDAQHEALLGSRRQQRERGHPHQEGLDSGTVILPERDREGTCLRRRKLLAQPGERTQQAVQCGEGERRLDLEALGAQHCGSVAVGDHRVEQRGLADARLASYDDAAGRPAAGLVDERREERPLGAPADQHVPNVHAHEPEYSVQPGTLTGATPPVQPAGSVTSGATAPHLTIAHQEAPMHAPVPH